MRDFGKGSKKAAAGAGRGVVSVGLAPASHKRDRMPGWSDGSVGFQSDDGKLYAGSESGSDFGEPWQANAVVGCGLDYATKQLFFTLNGSFVAATRVSLRESECVPTIGFLRGGEKVSVNFGPDFVADLKSSEIQSGLMFSAAARQAGVDWAS